MKTRASRRTSGLFNRRGKKIAFWSSRDVTARFAPKPQQISTPGLHPGISAKFSRKRKVHGVAGTACVYLTTSEAYHRHYCHMTGRHWHRAPIGPRGDAIVPSVRRRDGALPTTVGRRGAPLPTRETNSGRRTGTFLEIPKAKIVAADVGFPPRVCFGCFFRGRKRVIGPEVLSDRFRCVVVVFFSFICDNVILLRHCRNFFKDMIYIF